MIRVLISLFILLSAGTIFAQTALIEWAVPLKKNKSALSYRETGGVLLFGEKLLVTTRDGRVMAFSKTGKKIRSVRLGREITLPPVAVGEKIVVAAGNSLFLLDSKLSVIWEVKGKAPVISEPVMWKSDLVAQFSDNSIYLVDMEKGTVKANYVSYIKNEISYARLSSPKVVDDKLAVGFSNGTIVYFIHRINRAGAEELVPFYRFKTAGFSSYMEKREFYDIFSMLPMSDHLLFSNGERGGIVLSGKTIEKKGMGNMRLELLSKGEVVGYGEGGVVIISESGDILRTALETERFVSTLSRGDRFAMAAEQEGNIYIMDRDLKELRFSFSIPDGVSGSIAADGDRFYFISNRGVLYSLLLLAKDETKRSKTDTD